jgi:hypothetical protein
MTTRTLDDLDRSVEDFYAALGAEAEPAAAPAAEEPATAATAATAAAAATAVDLSAMTVDLISKDIVVLREMPLPLQQALCDALAPFAATPPASAGGPSFFRADLS